MIVICLPSQNLAGRPENCSGAGTIKHLGVENHVYAGKICQTPYGDGYACYAANDAEHAYVGGDGDGRRIMLMLPMLASALEMLMAHAGMSAGDEAAAGADHTGDTEEVLVFRMIPRMLRRPEGDTDDEADGDGEVAVIVIWGDGARRRWVAVAAKVVLVMIIIVVIVFFLFPVEWMQQPAHDFSAASSSYCGPKHAPCPS